MPGEIDGMKRHPVGYGRQDVSYHDAREVPLSSYRLIFSSIVKKRLLSLNLSDMRPLRYLEERLNAPAFCSPR